MKRVFLAIIMSFSIFNLFGQSTPPFKSVEVAEFEKAMANKESIVLDVRTPEEYAEGHIPGTHFNINVLDGDFTQKALGALPKERVVALYCRRGNRSKTAAKILANNGYTVVELASGFRGWVAAGKEVER